jgi:predicted lipase
MVYFFFFFIYKNNLLKKKKLKELKRKREYEEENTKKKKKKNLCKENNFIDKCIEWEKKIEEHLNNFSKKCEKSSFLQSTEYILKKQIEEYKTNHTSPFPCSSFDYAKINFLYGDSIK